MSLISTQAPLAGFSETQVLTLALQGQTGVLAALGERFSMCGALSSV